MWIFQIYRGRNIASFHNISLSNRVHCCAVFQISIQVVHTCRCVIVVFFCLLQLQRPTIQNLREHNNGVNFVCYLQCVSTLKLNIKITKLKRKLWRQVYIGRIRFCIVVCVAR